MGSEGIIGLIPDEMLVTTNNSKGYQLMRAMGFRERGKNSCFTNYEDSPEENIDDEDDFDIVDNQGFMLPKKR